jgi:hypothetical protein
MLTAGLRINPGWTEAEAESIERLLQPGVVASACGPLIQKAEIGGWISVGGWPQAKVQGPI